MTRILMVCLGNICRSPLAEGILQSMLPKNEFQVDSAGTSNHHIGDSPDSRSILVAYKNGLDISKQQARQIQHQDLMNFNYVFVMDRSNLNDVLEMCQTNEETSKVKLILDVLSQKNINEVPDPYYGGDEGFDNVYKMLNEACEIISEQLK